MICILRKTEHILVVFVVKQIVNTPTTIARLVNTENTHTAVSVGCLNQHEYSLIKILFILWWMRQKKKKIYKGVGFIGVFSFMWTIFAVCFEFDWFCLEFSTSWLLTLRFCSSVTFSTEISPWCLKSIFICGN
jgi:hypothetical protein